MLNICLYSYQILKDNIACITTLNKNITFKQLFYYIIPVSKIGCQEVIKYLEAIGCNVPYFQSNNVVYIKV